MASYVVQRLLSALAIGFVVAALVFFVGQFIPGDAIQAMLGQDYTEEAHQAWRDRLGLNDPILVQFGRFLQGALQGDLGTSIRTRVPVVQQLAASFPLTLQLSLAAMLVSVGFGVPAGIISAIRRNSAMDKAIMSLSVLGVSAPSFWFGILLLYLFALQLGWLPAFGAMHGIRSFILPAITLGMNYAALLARVTRSSMLDVLGEDYIRTARAKGLAGRVVIYKHALRNAAIPIVTIIGLQVGLLLAGAVVIETVFALPGMGQLLVVSVRARDFPNVQGAVLLLGFVIAFVNLLVDLAYGILNPRVRYG
ncbi:MAG: ABC transporter permease [Thermaerobacterales bacterium]